jgi:hypothetical protein
MSNSLPQATTGFAPDDCRHDDEDGDQERDDDHNDTKANDNVEVVKGDKKR